MVEQLTNSNYQYLSKHIFLNARVVLVRVMYFNLNTNVSGEGEMGHVPCAHFADGNLWFNLELGQVAVHFDSHDLLLKFCSLLDMSKDTTEYVEYDGEEFSLLALEEEDVGTRNLCIYNRNISIVFNIEVTAIAGLSNFLRAQPKEDNFD